MIYNEPSLRDNKWKKIFTKLKNEFFLSFILRHDDLWRWNAEWILFIIEIKENILWNRPVVWKELILDSWKSLKIC